MFCKFVTKTLATGRKSPLDAPLFSSLIPVKVGLQHYLYIYATFEFTCQILIVKVLFAGPDDFPQYDLYSVDLLI